MISSALTLESCILFVLLQASYVGQFSMPHIIGGSDLYHSETRQLAEARAEMAKERKVMTKEVFSCLVCGLTLLITQVACV